MRYRLYPNFNTPTIDDVVYRGTIGVPVEVESEYVAGVLQEFGWELADSSDLQRAAHSEDHAAMGANGNNIAFIGDSRMRYGYTDWYKDVYVDNLDGIEADVLGVGYAAPATTAVGTLLYRAADKTFQWTADGDTSGPWTPAVIGKSTIASGSVNRELWLILRSILGLPASDQTLVVTMVSFTTGLYYRTRWNSVIAEILSAYRNGPTPHYLGAGSAITAQLSEMLPWYNATAGGAGIDVIRIGANDIKSTTITAEEMISNAYAFFDARRAIGRKLVICGEPARWNDSVGDPLTAAQLEKLIAYNHALHDYATANPATCRYVDLYAISRDPSYIDGRPLTGILIDTVHDGLGGVLAFSPLIKTAIDALGGVTAAPYPMAGDTGIVFNNDSTWMTGSGGTLGNGCTGSVPNGLKVGRASGTTLTMVSSLADYADGHLGKQVQADFTSVTADEIAQIVSILPSQTPTLAAVGLAAGDVVQFEVDLELVSGAPTEMTAFLYLPGSNRRTSIYFPITTGQRHAKSPPILLAASDTTINQYVYIKMPASSTATVRVGESVTRQV